MGCTNRPCIEQTAGVRDYVVVYPVMNHTQPKEWFSFPEPAASHHRRRLGILKLLLDLWGETRMKYRQKIRSNHRQSCLVSGRIFIISSLCIFVSVEPICYCNACRMKNYFPHIVTVNKNEIISVETRLKCGKPKKVKSEENANVMVIIQIKKCR